MNSTPASTSALLPRRPIGTSQWQGNSPNARRVAPVLRVSEEFGGWMMGHLTRYPDVFVELSFEDWRKFQPVGWTINGTAISYIRFDRGPDRLFEFQFGRTLVMPNDDMLLEIRTLLRLFDGYSPFLLPPRMNTYELSLQPMPERQDGRVRQPPRGRRHPPSPGLRRVRVPLHHP